MNISMLSAGIT